MTAESKPPVPGRRPRKLATILGRWQARSMGCVPMVRPLTLAWIDPAAGIGRGVTARIVRATALCLAVWPLIGCPHGGGGGRDTMQLPLITSDDPRAEADIRVAREALEAGRAEEAASRYERFIAERPTDPLVVIAHLGLGKILLADGRTEDARGHFAVVASHEDPAVAERGRFYDGVALHIAGRHAEALDALRPFVGRTVDPEETALLLETIAAASERTGDRLGAIEALDLLARGSVPEPERVGAREGLGGLVAAATADEVDRAVQQLPRSGAAWPLVAERALRDAYRAGNLERVHELAEALREQGVELSGELAAMALRAERTSEADLGIVGAILPLSGRGREVGQLALRGLMLASGGAGGAPGAAGAPQVVFRDDAGDPDQAAQAVEDLVSLHRVVAIVGPITGATAARAAQRAQELGVPIVTLSPAEDLTRTGSMVFRLFPTAASETRELVAAAWERGARRFLVLHPDNAYGQTMAAAFAAQVRARGGQVVATQVYAPAATSFGQQLGQLRANSFDAVFVADASSKVALIAPALAAAGFWSSAPDLPRPRAGQAITLLAPSVGFDPDLARTSGRYLQGALFAHQFYAPTATGAGRQFADAYQERYGSAPDAFAAAAFDAFDLVRRAVTGGASDRSAVAEALTHMRGIETAGPSNGFLPSREPVRGTRVLSLRGNVFVPVQVPAVAGPPVGATK